MFVELQTLLAPPRFPEQDKNLPAILLNGVLLLSIFGLFISGIAVAITSTEPALTLLIYSLVILFLLVLYALMRRGIIFWSSVLLVLVMWVVITAACVALGGIDSPVFGAYLLLVLVAALLMGPTGGLGTASLSALSALLLFRLQEGGRMPSPLLEISETTYLAVQTSHFVLAALFLYIATRTIRQAYTRAISNEKALRHAVADLQTTTVSKDYVDKIIHSMTNLLIVTDPSGTILTVNTAVVRLLGYSEDALIGDSLSMLLTTDDSYPGLAALIGGQVVRNADHLFRAQDGREIPVLLTTSHMTTEYGSTIGVIFVAQDATERKEAEAKLTYQAQLLENVSDAIISTDMDLNIATWNKAAERVYGWKAQEVVGKKLTSVVQQSSGDLIDLDKSKWRREMPQRRKDGEQLTVLSSMSLVRDVSGSPTGVVAVNHDISQRKQAELDLQRRLEQLAMLRHVDEAVGSTLDSSRVLQTALNAAVRMTGADGGLILLQLEPGTFKVAQAAGVYAPYQSRAYPIESETINRAIETQQPQFITEIDDALKAQVRPGTVALMSVPLLSQQRLLGVVHVETSREGLFTQELFDFLLLVTARIAVGIDNARLYQVSQDQLAELQVLYEQVSKLEALKTDMIRIASHDLRAPVGIINGYVAMLQMDLKDRISETEMEFIDSIARQTARMDTIVSEILSLERIRQVAEQPLADRVDLRALVHESTEAHRPTAQEKRQQLDTHLPTDDGVLCVHGDAAQLREALSNLVANAVRYTPAGGHIQVRLCREGELAVLTVQDNGIGVPEEEHPRLFEAFRRVKNEDTAHIEGTGLGLNLVKNIVARHHGELVFESVYREGSTFGFKLPLVGGGSG